MVLKKIKFQYRLKGRGSKVSRENKLKEEAAKQHVEEIRTKKFSIGAAEPNPLTEDRSAPSRNEAFCWAMYQRCTLSHGTDSEDNTYDDGVEPTLEFVLTEKDIIGCDAPATLLVFNNEIGFSRRNMESLCSVGRSTKKGKRQTQGFVGEKGIGFKSVFLVSKQPHIFSNGYQVRFSEEPHEYCSIGYIVPEWIGDESLIFYISDVYGSDEILPRTIIVLPLRPDKVEPVRRQLSQLHPELLLFLSKIKRLYVRGSSSDPKDIDAVSAISIASETNHAVSRDQRAVSRVIHLSIKEQPDAAEETCQYCMWTQAFTVKPENKVEGRENVDEWVICLAFPFGKRLKRGTSCVGVFAFLPTSMVTNFPFILQADFILASSREVILLDNKWNLGILECVPSAYFGAFTSCVKDISLFSISQAFEFLPARASSFQALNQVRESIKKKLLEADIVPVETFSGEASFCKPRCALRILPKFRELLFLMKEQGVSLSGMSSLKKYVVHSSLDEVKYDPMLNFLGVPSVDNTLDWHGKCIIECNLVSQVADDVYIDLLHFISCNGRIFPAGTLDSVPLFKFINQSGKVEFCSSLKIKRDGYYLRYALGTELQAWLSKCNRKLGSPGYTFFIPNSTQNALVTHPRSSDLQSWFLSYVCIEPYHALSDYAWELLNCDIVLERHAIAFAYFVYHSHIKKFLSDSEVSQICQSMPIADSSGFIRFKRNEILVPATGSKWIKLFGPINPFSQLNYVDIGECYSSSRKFAGEHTPDKVTLSFLRNHTGAHDLPELLPPNAELQAASSELTSDQAFLLLDWIRFHRTKGSMLHDSFINSIRDGKWLKTSSGYNCPRQSVLPSETGQVLFETMKNVLTSFSVVDQKFYGNRINLYTDELKFLGVSCGLIGVQNTVMDQYKHLASSQMSKECAFSLLGFICLLREKNMLDEGWMRAIREGRWLKTCRGYSAPNASVLLQCDLEAEAVQIITNLHVIDKMFYGNKLDSFIPELALLGVTSNSMVYKLVAESFTFPTNAHSITCDCAFLILMCIRHLQSAATSFVEEVSDKPWLKTIFVFKCPSEGVLFDPNWVCLLNILETPIIDEEFYNHSIRSYTDELKAVGVTIDNDNALEVVVTRTRSILPLAPAKMISLLQCIREMHKTMPSQITELLNCLREEKLFKTRHGYKKPGESILFNSRWAYISFFIDLPLIDDSYYGISIYGYREEVKIMGVINYLEEGAMFVARGLSGPIEVGHLTAEATIALLDCIKILMQDAQDQCSLNAFLENITKSEFLKTSSGYKMPKDCLLLQEAWKDMLEEIDAPVIDERFYGTAMSAYEDQLKAMGVKINALEVCSLLASSFPTLAENSSISRIYTFLGKFKWSQESLERTDSQIWIPDQNISGGGQWVNSECCILHDRGNLFGSMLYSLDKYYDKDLLSLFATAFRVIEFPSVCHYTQLWGHWESNEENIILSQCSLFWDYVLQNWNPETENILKQNLTRVPVVSSSEGHVLLVSKDAVFIPDDLRLKKLFTSSGDCPLFAWLPKNSISAIKLSEVYSCLGVKKISETAKYHVKILQSPDGVNIVDKRNELINKGLIRMILAFLARKIQMPTDKRHCIVKPLLHLQAFENAEKILVCYEVSLGVNITFRVESKKVVHWNKKSNCLVIDRESYTSSMTGVVFASWFAQEITEGLLPEERTDAVNSLRNLIQMGFPSQFEENSVDFLLTRENIELSLEDEEFLIAAFSLGKEQHVSSLEKYDSTWTVQFCPSTPFPPQERTRQEQRATTTERCRLITKCGASGSELLLKKRDHEKRAWIETKDLKRPKRPPTAFWSHDGGVWNETKDLKMPKRPPSAFWLFMEDFRRQSKLDHPQLKVVSAVSLSRIATVIFKLSNHCVIVFNPFLPRYFLKRLQKPVEKNGTPCLML
ncbi:hypothetical protein Ancab_016619 [Ancistrocladus abbreviatus]